MSNRVKQVAETIKARLQIGSPLEVAMSVLNEERFTCEVVNERLEENIQCSMLCQKTVVEKRWWGYAEFHHVRVIVTADASQSVTSAHVSIIWGGMRGHRGEVSQI
jgi:hypothetical protein